MPGLGRRQVSIRRDRGTALLPLLRPTRRNGKGRGYSGAEENGRGDREMHLHISEVGLPAPCHFINYPQTLEKIQVVSK